MLRSLNFNSILWILLGLASLGYGGYLVWFFRRGLMYNFQFPFGLVFTGIGNGILRINQWFYRRFTAWQKIQKSRDSSFLFPGLPLLLWGVWKSI